MQILSIHCRRIIYSTCVQRLSVHIYTPMYIQLSLPLYRWTTTWCSHPVPLNRIQFSPLPPLAKSHLKAFYENLFPLHGSIFFPSCREDGGRWVTVRGEESGCCGDSSKMPSRNLPWPAGENMKLSGKVTVMISTNTGLCLKCQTTLHYILFQYLIPR